MGTQPTTPPPFDRNGNNNNSGNGFSRHAGSEPAVTPDGPYIDAETDEIINIIVDETDNDYVEPVPDEADDAIIAGDLIDPKDIDMDDVLDFQEIGTVYTIEGDDMTVATFQDGSGTQYAMVDVNNDSEIDFITDENLNPLVDNTFDDIANDMFNDLIP